MWWVHRHARTRSPVADSKRPADSRAPVYQGGPACRDSTAHLKIVVGRTRQGGRAMSAQLRRWPSIPL
jgi:hypothetical protein